MIHRAPPQLRLRSRDETHSKPSESSSGQGQGMIAAAISMLPVDVGTSVSPTIFRQSPQSGTNICSGGPGNTTCDLEVKDGQQGVQCDLCGSWYHAFCQDVSKGAYNALKKHEVLSFICQSCKKLPDLSKLHPQPQCDVSVQVSPMHDHPEPSTMHVMSELVKKVGDLELAMRDLRVNTPDMTNKMNTHDQSRPSKSILESSTLERPTSNNDYRDIMRSELREMEERKKRAASLVIRGLKADTASEAATKFSDIVESLIGKPATLTEVCRIRNDTDLYRGNVHNSYLRRMILDNAKHLKGSEEYSHVFIRRDLTFKQREELRAKYPPRPWPQQDQGPQTSAQDGHQHGSPSQPGEGSQPQLMSRPANPVPSLETVPKCVESAPPSSNSPVDGNSAGSLQAPATQLQATHTTTRPNQDQEVAVSNQDVSQGHNDQPSDQVQRTTPLPTRSEDGNSM